MSFLEDLNTELTTDPVPMPYLPLIEDNDQANADIINNTSGNYSQVVDNATVSSDDIRSATTLEAFDGLVTVTQAWFEWLTNAGTVSTNDETLQQLCGVPLANNSIWASSDRDEMNAAMTELFFRSESRATELDFPFVGAHHIKEARELG